MRGYVGEGRFTDDRLNTFGGAGVVEIPNMQRCSISSVNVALSTTLLPIFRLSHRPFTKPLHVI